MNDSEINLKKRKQENEYEEVNKMYKELYEQRKLKSQSTITATDFKKIFTSPKKNFETNLQSIDNLLSPEKKIEITKKLKSPEKKNQIEQNNEHKPSLNLQSNASFPFYLNKLRNYPNDQLLDQMLSFKDLLFEDVYFSKNFSREKPKRTLISAFMTTFGFEMGLLQSLAEAKVNLVIANDYNRDTKYEPIIRDYEGYRNFTLIHPPKNAPGVFYGVFHPKIWLLKFPEFLRIVIGSGNLTIADWTVWSNCFWFQDFMLKDNKFLKKTEKKETDKEKFNYDIDFKETLYDFIKNIMPPKINFSEITQINLDDYIFENIDIVLISSIPGRYPISNSKKYGLMKVKDVLSKTEPVEKNQEIQEITYQTTSLGSVDTNFINDFFYGFHSEKIDKFNKNEELQKLINVIYPTEKYIIDESLAGPEMAHPLCLNSKNYEKQNFLKSTLCKFEGSDNYAFHHGLLPHLKVCIKNKSGNEIDDNTIIYYGSHNFTGSAWGKFEKNRSQILISNTELGILIPYKNNSGKIKKEIINCIPFKYPAQKYEGKDQPWIAEKYYK